MARMGQEFARSRLDLAVLVPLLVPLPALALETAEPGQAAPPAPLPPSPATARDLPFSRKTSWIDYPTC